MLVTGQTELNVRRVGSCLVSNLLVLVFVGHVLNSVRACSICCGALRQYIH